MSLISKAINHLFNGVSQQAASLRDPSQCELMENCWPDVAEGLGKRPPVLHGAKLNADTSTNRKFHLINRDGGEQYVVTIKNNEILVYDRLTGAAKTVTTPDGLGYLSSTDPMNDFSMVTVADTTFIVNKTKVVTQDAATSVAPVSGSTHFVVVKAGVISTDYYVVLSGLTVSYTTSTTYTKTDGIAASLTASIDADPNYIAVRLGSVIKITRVDGAAFTCTTNDGYGDQALGSFSDIVNNSSQLPANFWSGYVVKVRGGLASATDDYYVHYSDNIWKETVPLGLQNAFTATTMPHKLVRNSDGTFTFSKIVWKDRKVGDDDSNPVVSFVGKTLNAVFFYRERLGFLSGEYVTLSRVSDYYNFWYSTASGQLDDDPIDVAAADAKVSYLYHALPFKDTLLLFSDSAQYQLSGGDILSAATVRLDPTTRFSAAKVLAPAAAGRNVFFAVNKGEYSSIREYYVTTETTSNDALDITAHVPAYVPKGLRSMDASALVDAVVAVSSSVGNELYAYKYLWDGDKKVQSSWGKWTLDSGATVVATAFVDAVLALVVIRADGTYVESINMQSHGVDTGMDRLVYLDRRVSVLGVYNSATNKTTWTLPYSDSSTDFQVALGAGFGNNAGVSITSSKPTATTVEASGDYSGFSCFVGKPYTQRYRFSEFFLKDSKDVALLTGRLQLRTLTVSFAKTTYFRVEVTPNQRETYQYPFTGIYLGDISATIGDNPLVSSRKRFPLMSNSAGLRIDLVNDSPSPSFFQGAEWEGEYIQRAGRT